MVLDASVFPLCVGAAGTIGFLVQLPNQKK